jgi:hypothetical protein
MINIITVYAVLFAVLSVLKAGAASYHNPINGSLIKAIIKIESAGNPKAISKEGAWGLMQIRHAVWEKELKKAGVIRHKQELFNPEKNIRAGEYILTKYYNQTGCIKKTLVKYSGNDKSYYEKVMIAYQGQAKMDRWFSFWPIGSFILGSGLMGMAMNHTEAASGYKSRGANRWQVETDDYRIDVLEKHLAGVRQYMMSNK